MILNEFKYLLITPARDEEEYIEKTIQAVISQTILPIKWVIVSDGSIDRTDEIVNNYTNQHGFIQLVRATSHKQRTFSSKVHAFKTGYEHLNGIEYDFIGMLDADVSFEPDYYERVLEKFRQNQKLGIAGGIRSDWCNGKFEKASCAKNSVGGPYQLFRRKCFEEIGGFIPIPGGGEDAVAESMARMLGWEVESFDEMQVYHYRRTGTATCNAWNVHFRDGKKCYLLGYHPLFQIARSVFRCKDKPYLLRGTLLLFGYLVASIRRYKKPVSDEFVKNLRKEQMTRLKSLVLYGTDPAFRR